MLKLGDIVVIEKEIQTIRPVFRGYTIGSLGIVADQETYKDEMTAYEVIALCEWSICEAEEGKIILSKRGNCGFWYSEFELKKLDGTPEIFIAAGTVEI